MSSPMSSSAPVWEALPADTQRRFIAVRGALVLVEGVGVALLATALDARLALLSLAGILLLHLALNGVAWLRLRQGGLGALELLVHLLVDGAGIAALVYLTGGYANPFISLLLVPLILAAVTLPPAHAWGLAAWVGVLYTLLMRYYQPLALQVSAEAAVDLHLLGMWLNFLLTAALVAAFAGRLAATLRRRDAQLAEAREQRLRDEQLFALGLQAAAAAHDLATPMASTRITLDELRRDYAGDDELERPLHLLSAQLARMESVLERLGDVARARGQGGIQAEPVDVWLARVLEHWGLMWPDVGVSLELDSRLGLLRTDTALDTVLSTLLNNAAQASPDDVAVRARRQGRQVVVQVADRGPGLDSQSGKAPGWGVGLELARGAMTRLGGRLEVDERPGGGVLAQVVIPLADAEPSGEGHE
ncbi:MAG: ATP-binding protein [Pseudomonadota bacterium]